MFKRSDGYRLAALIVISIAACWIMFGVVNVWACLILVLAGMWIMFANDETLNSDDSDTED